MDEIWSIEIASGRGHTHDQLPTGIIRTDQVDLTTLNAEPPWWKIWSAASDYTYPPLYDVLLRGWMNLFGNGPAAVRSLSALFSIASIVVFFDLCRLLHNIRIGYLAAGLMTFALAQIDIAQEARCYALLIFLAVCAADLLIRIEKMGVTMRRLALLALWMSAGFLTHYLFGGIAVVLFLYAMIRLGGRARHCIFFTFAGAFIFLLVVWGYPFYWQVTHFPGPAPGFLLEAEFWKHGELTLRRLVGLPGEFVAGEIAAEQIFSLQTPADVMLTIILLSLAAFTIILPILRMPWRRDLLLWVLWIFGTLGLVTAADLLHKTTMIGYIRYTILASVAVYAVIASFQWPSRPVLRDAVPLSVLAFAFILAIDRLNQPPPPKEDWQQLATVLDSRAAANDLLVFYNNDRWESPGTWYMGLRYYRPNSNRPWLLLMDSPSPELLAQVRPWASIWLVGLYPQSDGPKLFPGWECTSEYRTTAGAFCRLTHHP